MKHDALVEAARALRGSAEKDTPRADETRARVMASLRAEQVRRLSILRVAVPLAAVLVGSLAWAAAAGKLPASIGTLFAPHQAEPLVAHHHSMPTSSVVARPLESAIVSQPGESGSTPTPALQSPEPPEPAPPAALEPPTPVAPLRSRAVSRPPSDPRGTAVASRPEPASPPDADDEALYARAHQLHFVDRNPGAALAAWDAYLRAFPRGRLALESRYNRGLCLVRLGRRDEAAAALTPFAEGVYGGYRQAEARALLEAMASAPP
jgi:hypothetical protein